MSVGFKINKTAEPLLYENRLFTVSQAAPSKAFPFSITLADGFFLPNGFFYIVKADPTVRNSELYALKPSIEAIEEGSLKLGLSENPFASKNTPFEFKVYRIPLVFSLGSFGIFSF